MTIREQMANDILLKINTQCDNCISLRQGMGWLVSNEIGFGDFHNTMNTAKFLIRDLIR